MRVPILVRIPLWALAIYAALCLLAFLFQRNLMYFPDRSGEAEAVAMARRWGLEPWRDPQGRLRGWRRPGPEGSLCVVVLHGNAGTALDRRYYLDLFAGKEIILLEYPGYGPRPGEPSEKSLVSDAVEAISHLEAETKGRIVLVGESLGSGVAVQAAARSQAAVAGLILITPLSRMAEVGAKQYPYLPVRLLLRDRWDNASALATFKGPVAILVAGRDEVVGADQGRRLASHAPTARVWEQPRAGHNSVDFRPGAEPWPELLAYPLSTLGKGNGVASSQ